MIGGVKMKKLKNILGVVVVLVVALMLVGCGKEANVAGSLTEIMEKLYTGVKDEEKPMMLTNIELNEENFEGFAFVKDVKYEGAIASESGVGSIPHSVVLIRLENSADASNLVKEIKANANPRKWICVEAENVIVKSKGDLVMLIMSNELASRIEENFDNL